MITRAAAMTISKVIQRMLAGRRRRDKLQKLYEQCSQSMSLLESLKKLNETGEPSVESRAAVLQVARQRFAVELQQGLDHQWAGQPRDDKMVAKAMPPSVAATSPS